MCVCMVCRQYRHVRFEYGKRKQNHLYVSFGLNVDVSKRHERYRPEIIIRTDTTVKTDLQTAGTTVATHTSVSQTIRYVHVYLLRLYWISRGAHPKKHGQSALSPETGTPDTATVPPKRFRQCDCFPDPESGWEVGLRSSLTLLTRPLILLFLCPFLTHHTALIWKDYKYNYTVGDRNKRKNSVTVI